MAQQPQLSVVDLRRTTVIYIFIGLAAIAFGLYMAQGILRPWGALFFWLYLVGSLVFFIAAVISFLLAYGFSAGYVYDLVPEADIVAMHTTSGPIRIPKRSIRVIWTTGAIFAGRIGNGAPCILFFADNKLYLSLKNNFHLATMDETRRR